MQTIDTVSEMQKVAAEMRAHGKNVGLVPTMGARHNGNLSLIDIAKKNADVVIVSIFVNPAQFGPNEDAAKYPRRLEGDQAACEKREVDYLFTPSENEMYPSNYSTYVVEESLSLGLSGISRPSLYRGKATVFVKLINIIRPHTVVLGQKDAQGAVVIERVVRDLNRPVNIEEGPTVRADDGLAEGAYNDRFTSSQRRDALALYQALRTAREMDEGGMRNVARISGEIIHILAQHRGLRVIYVSIVHRESLETLRMITPGETLISAAVWCNEFRLVDNILL